MAMFGKLRLIDLSVPLEDGAAHEPIPPRISYATHEGEGLRCWRWGSRTVRVNTRSDPTRNPLPYHRTVR